MDRENMLGFVSVLLYLTPQTHHKAVERPLRAQVLYTRVRRLARGRYELSFEPLHERGETLPPGEVTTRYARALEAEIRADPAGWWWSHKRWKRLKK